MVLMATQINESHKVPYRVRVVGGTCYDENLVTWRNWCLSDEVTGLFKIRCKSHAGPVPGGHRVPVRIMMFSDPAMAFAFRMRWT
jgi:hypothetical protein